MKELRIMSEVELLQTHSTVIAELHRRGVVKTQETPSPTIRSGWCALALGCKYKGILRQDLTLSILKEFAIKSRGDVPPLVQSISVR